jgi:hypothetical protein
MYDWNKPKPKKTGRQNLQANPLINTTAHCALVEHLFAAISPCGQDNHLFIGSYPAFL